VTVNDTLDEIHNPGCATTGRGTCSLRDAVLYANANVTRLGRPRGR
jgi:CSLREA domain-containing protein